MSLPTRIWLQLLWEEILAVRKNHQRRSYKSRDTVWRMEIRLSGSAEVFRRGSLNNNLGLSWGSICLYVNLYLSTTYFKFPNFHAKCRRARESIHNASFHLTLPLLLLLQHTNHSRSTSQPSQPSIQIRELFLPIKIRHHFLSPDLPADERQISICGLVAHKILAAFEVTIKNTRDALDIAEIAIDSRGDLLTVMICKSPSIHVK